MARRGVLWTIGLVTVMTLTILSLCTFMPWHTDVAPSLTVVASTERRLTPLGYTMPLEDVQLVIHASDETGVPVWLLCRLLAWESGWNHRYRSVMNFNGTYDLGVAALNSAMLAWFSTRYNGGKTIDPYDPSVAIPVAARYMADLKANTGTWRGAIVSYAGHRSKMHTDEIMGKEEPHE